MPERLSAVDHVAVTKSDVTTYNPPLQGLYIGGTGNVAIKCHSSGAAVTYAAVPVGTFMPVECYQVLSTGTTATNIVGLMGDV